MDPTAAVTLIRDEGVRQSLAQNQELGAGNFLEFALRTSPAPDAPILHLEMPYQSFAGDFGRTLSLRDLDRLADRYAAWYRQAGVVAMDPVFVYLDDSVAYLVHYLALTRIGAIGVLTNGNLDGRIAALHAARTGAVGIVTDAAHRDAILPHIAAAERTYRFIVTDADFSDVGPLPPGARFRHHPGDPVMIAHSSGTTGVPKAVPLEHDKYFFGVRYRLGLPRIPGGERILSSLPHSHNCAVAYIMLAILSGTPVFIASDHSGSAVLKHIVRFRPTMVVSFPQTFVELTECPLEDFDLTSVNLWFNGGDAAHEAHIRRLVAQGSRIVNGERRSGSVFVDGMGSSEMGFSLFRHVHTPESNRYGRCVGKPLEWAEAQILADDGSILPAGAIGRLGVKAPSVTSGYWNDSILTHKSRLSGYFLTGDLCYRDAEGFFYHVDRTPDPITTKHGIVYSLQTEELLLMSDDRLADCSVAALGAVEDAGACVYARLRGGVGPKPTEVELLSAFNATLRGAGLTAVDAVKIVGAVPLGTTGKVLKRELRRLAGEGSASWA